MSDIYRSSYIGQLVFNTSSYSPPASGTTFTLSSGISYTETMWSDEDTQWVDLSGYEWYPLLSGRTLKGIWTDDYYVYAVFSDGMEFVDLATEEIIATINYLDGFNSVCADNYKVYLATNSGIKYVNKTDVSPSISGTEIHDTLFPVYDSVVNYLHYDNNHIMCCTNSGVNIIKQLESNEVICTQISGSYKCFAAGNNRYYYTTNSGDMWALNRLEGDFYNWSTPTYIYTTDSGILSPSSRINDIYITTGTSYTNSWFNTLFVATDINVYAIDEGTGATKNITDLFPSYSGSEFTSIWADNTARYNRGKLYMVSKYSNIEKLSVVDLEFNHITDYYTTVHTGNLGETLNGQDIVDINVRGT